MKRYLLASALAIVASQASALDLEKFGGMSPDSWGVSYTLDRMTDEMSSFAVITEKNERRGLAGRSTLGAYCDPKNDGVHISTGGLISFEDWANVKVRIDNGVVSEYTARIVGDMRDSVIIRGAAADEIMRMIGKAQSAILVKIDGEPLLEFSARRSTRAMQVHGRNCSAIRA